MDRKLFESLKDIFEFSEGEELSRIVLALYSAWDSFNIMQMLETFESEYGLTLSLEELKGFKTMEDVYLWAEKGRNK